MIRISRKPWTIASLILAIVAAVATAYPVRAQLGESGLNWQQRFLGILPLVKPNPKDPVVVTVNGAPITAAEIADYAKTEAQMINATSTEESNAVFRDASENLINRQLLLQEAARRKITIPDGEVAQRARQFQIAGGEGQAAPPSSAPDALLMNEVRGSMMIEKMLDDEFRTHHVQPTEAQIQDYYDQHRDLFVKDPGEVEIAHIAVKLPPNATDAQKKAAAEKIIKIYKEAQKNKDFAAIAKQNSEDTESAAKGGDLGYFRPGQLPPVVDKMVFATPVGQLTQILESNLGYSFIKVVARRGETNAPLAEVKTKIAEFLRDENEDMVVKALIKKIGKGTKVEFKSPAGDATNPPQSEQLSTGSGVDSGSSANGAPSSNSANSAPPGSCPTTFAYLAPQLPKYNDPDLTRIRTQILEGNLSNEMQRAISLGYTPQSAVSAALKQAKAEEASLHSAQSCMQGFATDGGAQEVRSLQNGTFDFSVQNSATVDCAKAYVAFYYAWVSSRESALGLACLAASQKR